MDKSRYFNYLDGTLVRSKFKLDIFKTSREVLLRKFPELSTSTNNLVGKLVAEWIMSSPHIRLNEPQLELF